MSDLLEDLPDERRYQSSSERKAERLPLVFSQPYDLVIALGTAAHPSATSQNAAVFVGTAIFMHNANPNGANPDSNWMAGPFDTLVTSTLTRSVFDSYVQNLQPSARLFVPARNTPGQLRVVCDHDLVSLGTLNVTDDAQYAVKDAETMSAFQQIAAGREAVSVETTHGLIRAVANGPFLFVSGIANQLGEFRRDVLPNEYAQNFAAAHNAAIVAAWLVESINQTSVRAAI